MLQTTCYRDRKIISGKNLSQLTSVALRLNQFLSQSFLKFKMLRRFCTVIRKVVKILPLLIYERYTEKSIK